MRFRERWRRLRAAGEAWAPKGQEREDERREAAARQASWGGSAPPRPGCAVPRPPDCCGGACLDCGCMRSGEAKRGGTAV